MRARRRQFPKTASTTGIPCPAERVPADSVVLGRLLQFSLLLGISFLLFSFLFQLEFRHRDKEKMTTVHLISFLRRYRTMLYIVIMSQTSRVEGDL